MSVKVPRNISRIPNPKRLYVFGGVMGTRHFTGIVRLAGRLLRVRYVLFGSAVGGGMAASKVQYSLWYGLFAKCICKLCIDAEHVRLILYLKKLRHK